MAEAVDGPYVESNGLGLALITGGALAGGVALWACATRALGDPGRPRRSWTLLTVSTALMLGGTVSWLISGEADTGWVPPAVLLGAGLVAACGAMLLPGAPPHASGRARTVVDGLIVAGSILFVGWTLGLDDVWRSAAVADRWLVLAAAEIYLALAAGVIVTLTRAPAPARGGLIPVTAAFLAFAGATAALAYASLSGSVDGIRIAYLGWPIGWLLLAYAAALGTPGTYRSDVEPGLPTRASVFIPSAPFATALVAAAVAGARGDFNDFLIWTGVAVAVLIVARQVLALVENISFWRRLEHKVETRTVQIRRNEARFRSLVQNSSDVITVVDSAGTIQYQSPSSRAVFGYAPHEIASGSALDLIHDEDRPRVRAAAEEIRRKPGGRVAVECRVRHRDGRWCYVEAIASNVLDDPSVGAFVVNTRDITERKELERQLAHRAFHDPLTNLANRALFGDRLGHSLSRSARTGNEIAVLFLDLDEFKKVNDSLGHGVGDDLLSAVAERLAGCLPSADTIARLGGDEFAILMEEVDSPLNAARAAERILTALEPPIQVGGRQVHIKGSIGIATSRTAGGSAQQLLSAADVAMYSAKAKDDRQYEFFEPEMHAALIERLELEEALQLAVDKGQLVLDYQPIVSLTTRSLRGVEALLRWQHPRQGLLPPNHFLHVAEETGLIVPIGRWALRAACVQAKEWRESFPDAPSLSMVVNLSAKQLDDPSLVSDVSEAVESVALDPADLALEITESAIVDSPKAVSKLQLLRNLGVRLAIDDFGTGYSSLSYLRTLPVDILKIDRVFLEDMAPGSQQAAIVEAIITMSRRLGITPVAEGVERPEQAAGLELLGCSLAQGFYFGQPAAPERIAQLLATGDEIPASKSEGTANFRPEGK